MWSIVFLVLAVIGIFIGKAIANSTDSSEIEEYGVAIVVLFGLIVTIPMLFLSYGYLTYYLLNIVFGLSITFWESILVAFLIKVFIKKG